MVIRIWQKCSRDSKVNGVLHYLTLLSQVMEHFRILGALFLLVVLYQFNKNLFIERRHQNLGFVISVLGSGLGWLAVFAGKFTSDFWVAEAYPFLTMYTNPHFSIGLSLMILTLLPGRKKSWFAEFALGVGLAIIQPFAVIVVLIVKIGKMFIGRIEGIGAFLKLFKSEEIFSTLSFAVGGGLVLIYQYWSILSDPILSLWNAQNITVSPEWTDLLISLSPCLALAALGIKKAWREEEGKILVIWAAVSLGLVFVPWNLQRRFLTGIYVPLAGLAVYGLRVLEQKRWVSFRFGAALLLTLSIPTNVVVLASGIQAAAKQDAKVYLERDIKDGLDWINENTAPESLVLTDHELGLFIPSFTGRRVIYGHPYETVNAGMEKKFLREFIDGDNDNLYFDKKITDKGIDVLFLAGEISEDLENWICQMGMTPDYENTLLRIYLLGQS